MAISISSFIIAVIAISKLSATINLGGESVDFLLAFDTLLLLKSDGTSVILLGLVFGVPFETKLGGTLLGICNTGLYIFKFIFIYQIRICDFA